MNRAMFSGVAGMKAHQTKMDVIGNNISNVNTFGYKSQRAVFSDIYYQTLRGASAGTTSSGGTNPSMIGYGSSLTGVQSQMTQSGAQNTGFGLDVSIAGEGYLQVMDSQGNIFYTRAGMLDYDSNGYLTDINGNFVLGSTGNDGNPASQRIKLDNVGSVEAARPTTSEEINNTVWTITASNTNAAGNISINLNSSDSMPIGQKATAVISNGSINITLNAKEKFADINDLNTVINQAITDANGGIPHTAGNFTISSSPASTWTELTGEQIAGTNFGYDKGSIDLPADGIFGGFKFESVGNDFSLATGERLIFDIVRTHDAEGDHFEITARATDGSKTYSAKIDQDQMTTSGKIVLKNGSSMTDVINMTFPSYASVINTARLDTAQWTTHTPQAADPADAAKELIQSLKDGSIMGGFTGNLPAGAFGDPPTAVPEMSLTYDPGTSKFTLTVGDYTTTFEKDDCGKELTLNAPGGGSIQLKAPSYTNLLSASTNDLLFTDPADANKPTFDATSSQPSKDLGLSRPTFTLIGGTVGGAITLDKLTSITIGADGTVTVAHPEKGVVVAGKISLANFANPSGLSQEGNNYFSATANSGEPQLAFPGSDGTGSLKNSMLEMSNVDLSQEMADMITTQRGFQANSRVITVSDTMLEELINLKR